MNNDNFFSIDRLVEFGLGVGVAQQMVRSMNHAVANTVILGAMNPMPWPQTADHLFVLLDGKPAGPFTEAEMMKLITQGSVHRNTYVWRPGLAKWEFAENIPEVLKLVALTPPPFVPGEKS